MLTNDYSSHERDLITLDHKINSLKREIEEGGDLPNSVRKILSSPLSGIHNTIGNILSTKEEYVKALNVAISANKNFIITDWIPTKDVLPLFDAAIIHGGLGTVFSTINAEIPFISIPMHAEQELNADYCVDKKICLKVQPFNSSIRKRLKNHLIEITNNEIYKINITKYAEKVRSKRNVQRLDEFIEQSIAKYKGEI